jgi:hypothetical protein
MPSNSVANFLDQAQANRVLIPEQVEQLIRQPDAPQSDLTALCEYLERRGVLTRFQADALREGRAHELNFAGYPVVDAIGLCPGGTEYRALHPSLRTPVALRRLRADLLAPGDTTGAYVQRARAAAGIQHPHLVTLLDAGFYRDEPYAVVEPPVDAADLDTLVRDIGPMPGFLAAEFARQAAGALRAAHERGLAHGDVRPGNVLVGPLTTKTAPDGRTRLRPAPNAVAKLAELGLVPFRPPVNGSPPPAGALPYLPPERLTGRPPDPRGDLYGLGATLYYLLTGRPPFAGSFAEEVLRRVRSDDPAPLSALRPDLPADLARLVGRLMAKRPEDRPATAADAEAALAPFCRTGTSPGSAIHMAAADAEPVVELEPVAESAPSGATPAEEWGVDQLAFSTSHADPAPRPKRTLTDADKKRTRLMIVLGLGLHLTAVGLLAAWLLGAFEATPEPTPAPTEKKQDPPRKAKKKDRDRDS